MKSKILSYLGVPENISDLFSQGEKDFIQLTEGMQEIYAAAPEGSKKDALALAIVENNRTIMAFLKSKNLGIYASQNVQVEQGNLPASTQQPKPQKPPKQQPQQQPQPPKPEPPKPETQQPTKKARLKSFTIIWNEGIDEFEGKVFTTWKDAQYAFNTMYNSWKQESMGYDKVKVEIIWENGKRIVDRIDVGDSDYNPSKETLGEYLQKQVSSAYESNFQTGERKTVMWEDEVASQTKPEEQPPKPEPKPQQPKPQQPKPEFEIGVKFYARTQPELIYTIVDILGGYLTIEWEEKDGKKVSLSGVGSFTVQQGNDNFNDGSWIKVEEPQEEFSKEDLELSIKGLMVMVKMNDEEAKSSVKSLLSFYKSLYGEKEYKSKYGKLKL